MMTETPREGWLVQRAHCMGCGHAWLAVRPVERATERLECSVCHEMTGVVDG